MYYVYKLTDHRTGNPMYVGKVWNIVDPNGNEHVVDNLLEFSKKHNAKYNIKPRTMYEQIRTNKKGWSCRAI